MTITTKSAVSRAVKSVALCLFCVTLAQAQQTETRLLKRQKVAPVAPAPLEFSNLQVNGSPINFDQPFSADDNWVKAFSFDVKNVSGKVITHFRIGLLLHNPNNQQRATVTMVSYGRNTGMPGVEPSVRVAPGEMVHAVYEDKQYESFKRMCNHIGLDRVQEITLNIEMAVFDDETMWRYGYLHRRDSVDPLRWNVIGREPGSSDSQPTKKPAQ
jgi:hypothetical protein